MIVDCKNTKILSFTSDPVANAYCADIRKYKPLSLEEERKLLKTMKYGSKKESEEARNKLILSIQRFVISFARKFAREDNVMDLIQEATIGLITAIDKYDFENNNVRITTYAAHWMRRVLNDYLATTDPMVVPANAQKLYTYAKKARNQFWVENQRNPTVSELQDILKEKYNVNISHVEDLVDYVSTSIDETFGDDEDTETPVTREYNIATATNEIDAAYEMEDLSAQIEEYLSILTKREQDVIKMSYGIGCDQLTNDGIGEKLGMCGERVRQILKESHSKLQKRFGKTA